MFYGYVAMHSLFFTVECLTDLNLPPKLESKCQHLTLKKPGRLPNLEFTLSGSLEGVAGLRSLITSFQT